MHVGYVRLHGSKVSKPVLALLNKYSLGPEIYQALVEAWSLSSPDLMNSGQWFEVKEEAADLILSGLAARVAWEKGFGLATNSPLNYSLVALNALGIGPRSGSFPGPYTRCMLGSRVISMLIPESIDQIPIETYLELRREFADIREPLHRLILECDAAAGLDGIANAEALQQRLEISAKELSDRIETIQQKKMFARIKQWAPTALLSLITMAGVMPLNFQLGLVLAATTVTISVIEKIMQEEPDRDLIRVAGAVSGIRAELPAEVEQSVQALL